MSSLALWSVINIVALIAGLAIYLFIVSSQLKKVATNLEESADLVWDIKKDAEAIEPGLTSINSTGRVVAGALPLLYGMGKTEESWSARRSSMTSTCPRRSRNLPWVRVDRA